METLTLAESTPRTESALKSLFWPSITNGSDVDYLGAQGYWVCTVVGLFMFLMLVATGHGVMGTLLLFFYYIGGVGVRERSVFAASVILGCFLLDTMVALCTLWLFVMAVQAPAVGATVIRVLLTALLISNFRATLIASRWNPELEQAELPVRKAESWSERFVDQLPTWLWPKVRAVYYVVSSLVLLLSVVGMMFSMVHLARLLA
jgi:hypothetical protein